MGRMNRSALARPLGVLLAAAFLAAAPVQDAKAQTRSEMKALIDDLVAANHILYRQGVLDGFGHVSVRDPRNAAHFLMASAKAPGRVTARDIMEFDLDGKPVTKDDRPTYSERFIHAEIYRARPDVNAVVHSHSPTVIPFSVTQVPLQALMSTSAFLGSGAPVFEIRKAGGMTDMLVRTPALGKSLAETLGKNAVVLLRGHGNAVVGPDIKRAVSRAIYTEVSARLQIQAMALGGPITYLAPEEIDKLEKGRDAIRRGSGHGQDRTWEMWREEADRK